MNRQSRRAPGQIRSALLPFSLGVTLVSVLLFGPGCGYDPSQKGDSAPTPPGATPLPSASPTPCPDQDDDGVCSGQDCNDRDPSIYPGADEVCDLKDNDCDGVRDVDDDGDGYISAGICPEGDDCDDSNPGVHPGADEVCNYVDDDCNGTADDGVEPQTYYRDNDGDGYGSGGLARESCTQPPNFSPEGDDCNDWDSDIHPGAEEVCNGIDDDCDGVNDDGVKLTTYPDEDGDGYGDGGATPRYSCTLTDGYVLDDTDCDDSDPSVYSGADEICNSADDDCDGEVDDGLPRETYYQDADGDGHGVDAIFVSYCAQPEGFASSVGDCDDSDPEIHPGADERCNGLDDDCDGSIPDVERQDGDGDGTLTCDDCDDTDSAIHPGAQEACNHVDDDCDGQVDEDFPEGIGDVDGDGVQDCLDDCPRWVDASAAPGGVGTWDAPFAAIQDAIDMFAVDSTCSTVRVMPGEYSEQIDFKGYPIIVEAAVLPPRIDVDAYLNGDFQEPEPDTVAVIDGQGNGPVVTVSQSGGQQVALVGFVIENGGAGACGGGVLIRDGSPRIERNRIEGSSAERGAGICILGTGAPSLTGNDIVGNRASATGGGLHVAAGAAPRVDGNAFLDNSAGDGAGLYLEAEDAGTSAFQIAGNAFYLNVAEGNGGGIALDGQVLGTIEDNALAYNQAAFGGGVHASVSADLLVTVSRGFVEDNIASQAGGGVMVTGSGGVSLEATVVARCVSPLGAGIYVDSLAGLLLNEVTLDSNGVVPGTRGGGLYVAPEAKATITSSIIQFNDVTGEGGGIYAAPQSSLAVTATYLASNAARLGAALYADGPDLLDIQSDETRETEITFNEAASNGGGLYLANLDPKATVGLVAKVRIHDNRAANGAGMVIDNSSLGMINNQIRNNTAIVGQGGGILCQGDLVMSIPPSNRVDDNVPDQVEGCE